MKTCYDNGQTAEVSWSLGSLPAAAGELPP